MKTLKVDPDTFDLVLNGQNSLEMVDGIDEETQSIRQALRTNQGEFFLNIEHGLAYEHLQVKEPNMEEIRAVVIEAIMKEDRVDQVLELEVDFSSSGRELTISFKVLMKSGLIVQNSEVI